MGIAIRRHHRHRLMKARKRYWCGENDRKRLSKLARTPNVCSSPFCCGNKRLYYGPTMQERRFHEGIKDEDYHCP